MLRLGCSEVLGLSKGKKSREEMGRGRQRGRHGEISLRRVSGFAGRKSEEHSLGQHLPGSSYHLAW